MLEIIRSKRFLKEFEAVMKSSKPSLRKRIDERLKFAIKTIKEEKPLPKDYKDHYLGDFSEKYPGCRDCHILGDLVLIYKIDKRENTFTILRFGGHGKLELKEEILNIS